MEQTCCTNTDSSRISQMFITADWYWLKSRAMSLNSLPSFCHFWLLLCYSWISFFLFFFFANLIWGWISKLLSWMIKKRTNAKHQDEKRTRCCWFHWDLAPRHYNLSHPLDFLSFYLWHTPSVSHHVKSLCKYSNRPHRVQDVAPAHTFSNTDV